MRKYLRRVHGLYSVPGIGTFIVVGLITGYGFGKSDESWLFGICTGLVMFHLLIVLEMIMWGWIYGRSYPAPDDDGWNGGGGWTPPDPCTQPPGDDPEKDVPLFVDDVLSQFAKHAAPSSQPERESTR